MGRYVVWELLAPFTLSYEFYTLNDPSFKASSLPKTTHSQLFLSTGMAITDYVFLWIGHGINTEFHPPPWIPHYAKNKAVGVCKPGMTFTIEPILALGNPKEVYWPDQWTNVTVDGKRSAQFGAYKYFGRLLCYANVDIEHTLLVTETGVEVLTAGNENSPGGPIPMPTTSNSAEGGSAQA